MPDPTMAALDIETYGKCERGWNGNLLPRQTVFQPSRSLAQDGVKLSDLILSCAITLPQEDTRSCPAESESESPTSNESPSLSAGGSSALATPSQASCPPSSSNSSSTTSTNRSNLGGGWDMTSLATLSEGSSLVFRMHIRQQRRMLRKWLRHLNTLLLMNGPFDLMMLRRFSLSYRSVLNGTQTLIDLSVLNYLHNEMRPEKSLKNLSPILQTHIYRDEETEGSHRYTHPRWTDAEGHGMLTYNADDTHATLLGIIELSRRIGEDYHNTYKLSPFCIQFYSDAFWTVIRMSEAGLCMDKAGLAHYEHDLTRRCQMLTSIMQEKYGVILQGQGSEVTKLAFMEEVCTFIETNIEDNIRDHPLFQLTEKKQKISLNDVNRRLFVHMLKDDMTGSGDYTLHNRYLQALKLFGLHIKYQKILSSYTWPYLRYKRKKHSDHGSALINQENHRCLLILSDAASSSTRACAQSTPPNSNDSSRATCVGQPNSTGTSSGSTSTDGPSQEENPIRQRLRRQRTPNQWLKRHQQRQIRRRKAGTLKEQAKLRKKAACRLPTGADYSPRPVEVRAAWKPPPPVQVRAFSHPTWYVTPSYAKDAGGDTGGTLQGRITCKGGSHQTDPPLIRRFYISRWDDGSIVGYDLAQIEMRGAALVSGDEGLVRAYTTHPTNLHRDRAIFWFGQSCVDEPDFKESFYQPAKHSNFTDLYLGGALKLQETILRKGNVIVPLEQCHDVVNRRQELRPGLSRWQRWHIRKVKEVGYYEVPFIGQTRRFEGGDKFEDNEIVNMPIQALAGNVLLRIQAYIHHHGPSINASTPPWLMFHQVYDAIFFDLRDSSHLPQLDALVHDAVQYVQNEGYWLWNQELYRREIPIEYERTIYASEDSSKETAT